MNTSIDSTISLVLHNDSVDKAVHKDTVVIRNQYGGIDLITRGYLIARIRNGEIYLKVPPTGKNRAAKRMNRLTYMLTGKHTFVERGQVFVGRVERYPVSEDKLTVVSPTEAVSRAVFTMELNDDAEAQRRAIEGTRYGECLAEWIHDAIIAVSTAKIISEHRRYDVVIKGNKDRFGMFSYGHQILQCERGRLSIRDAGYPTPTIANRLRDAAGPLIGKDIYEWRGRLYIGGRRPTSYCEYAATGDEIPAEGLTFCLSARRRRW